MVCLDVLWFHGVDIPFHQRFGNSYSNNTKLVIGSAQLLSGFHSPSILKLSPLCPRSPLLLILSKRAKFELLLVEVLLLDISTHSCSISIGYKIVKSGDICPKLEILYIAFENTSTNFSLILSTK
jgi:hypothetical protein